MRLTFGNHRQMLVPPCVNGDIAVQWEWSKFDPSQYPNPLVLTYYDKTVHNRLRPQDEHVTQNLFKSVVRERLAKYVIYKACLYFYFSPDSPTEVTPGRILTHNGSNCAQSRKEVPFWGPHSRRQHLGGPSPPKSSKFGVNMHCRASELRSQWRLRS